MSIACLAHLLPVTGRGNVGDRANRLRHHGGHVALLLENIFDEPSARHIAEIEIRRAVPVGISVGATKAGERSHVFGARHQGPDWAGSEGILAADTGSAESGTMKGIPEG